MAEELPSTPPGSELAAATVPDSQPLPPSQPDGSPDSRLAAILAKQARQEKLSAAERGYLGSIKRRGTPKAVAADSPAPSLPPAPPASENPLFAVASPAAAAAPSSPAPAVNSDLLHRAANSLLSSLDKATQIYVGYEARQAGADASTAERFKKAVQLQPENRQLIVENSDPILLAACEWFGCTPENLEEYVKKSGFLGGLFAHGLGVYTAVKELREARLARPGQSQDHAAIQK